MATMAEAKRDFDNGVLRCYRIVLTMGVKTVELEYLTRAGIGTDTLDDARTKKTRQFKTWDAAVSALEQIGFQVNALKGV